ncbi:hypothetical protein AAII07_38685 [Microvirga sp. 0TCS3.31]
MPEQALDVVSIYAAVPTSDMTGAESFYEAVIGRPADSHPMPSLAQWEWGESVLQSSTTPSGPVVAQVAVLIDPDGNQVTLVEAR